MKIKKLLFLFLLVTSPLLHAEVCDEFKVSFMVNGVDKWKGLSTVEIYQLERKEKDSVKTANPNTANQGVMLKNLVVSHAKEGTLIVNACGGKSKTFEVATLLESNPEKSGFSLTLSKKKFFKLVNTNNSKPILKKIYQLKLVL